MGETHRLYSAILREERVINVYVPPDHDSSSESISTVYVLDGETLFDLAAALIDYYSRIFRIPRMIVVGIENTDRTRDLTTTAATNREGKTIGGGADRFLSFLEEELIPHIEKTYGARQYRAIIGHSLGGLFVISTLLTRPLLFNACMALSPYLSWDRAEILTRSRLLPDGGETAHRLLFVANESPLNHEQTRQMETLMELLRNSGMKNLESECKTYAGSDHMNLPAVAIPDGLDFFFPGFVQER